MTDRAQPAVLVQPPVFDPFAPLLGVPALSAALKAAGRPAIPLDLNIALYHGLATDAGIERARRDRVFELEWLSRESDAGRRWPDHVRASMNRVVLERERLADEVAATYEVLRNPESYRFDANGRLRVTERAGAFHAVQMMLDVPPMPFSASRALAMAGRSEPLPFYTWLRECALPEVRALQPAWVGISIMFERQLLPALVLARFLREVGVRVFAGGFHLSTVGADGLAQDPALFDCVDGVVVGEGEIAIERLDASLREDVDLEAVPGLVFRRADGSVRASPPAPMPDMRELERPDLASMPIDRYLSPAVILPYQVSRGCYFGKCTFCNFTAVSPGYRRRPIDLVIADLARLAPVGRLVNFTMEAELPSVCRELSDALIHAGLGLTWEVMCRLDRAMHRSVLERMAASGCTTIFFGLESAASRVNALMFKSVSGEVARRIIDDCADVGINVVLSGIQNFPGETEVERAQTAAFYQWVHERVGDRILVSGGAHEFRLTRASPIWEDPASFGVETQGLETVGPLAVSVPHRTVPARGVGVHPAYGTSPIEPIELAVTEVERGRSDAPGGRPRDPLMPIEWLERAANRSSQPPAGQRPPGAPPRAPVPFNHDLLRLTLEGCNPEGFRHLAIANRSGATPPLSGRPSAFAIDAAATISKLAHDPRSGGAASLIFCINPHFSKQGVVLPDWFAAALETCGQRGGADLERLTEVTARTCPASSPPAEAWPAKLVPALWTAGILCDADA